jgi:hypothetical protein
MKEQPFGCSFHFLELSKGRNHLVVRDFGFLGAQVEKG